MRFDGVPRVAGERQRRDLLAGRWPTAARRTRGGAAPAIAQRAQPSVAHARRREPPAGTPSELLALDSRRAARTAAPAPGTRAARSRVVNGDLTFVRQPLLLGHYRVDRGSPAPSA